MILGDFFLFILCGLVFSLTLNIIFFIKKHIQNEETKIFKCLLLTNYIGLILELICTFLGYNAPTNSLISHISTKLYLLDLMFFILFMTLYMFTICYVISYRKKIMYYNRLKKVAWIILLISSLILIILPIQTNVGFATGISVDFTFIIFTIVLLMWGIVIKQNIKYINKKKLIPLIVFVLFLTIIALIQKIHPEITLTTVMDFLIVFIMYNTIENPDLKMVEELIKNKKLTETNIEDKSNILFKISQEVRMPASEIMILSKKINEENKLDNIYKHSKKINMYSKNIHDSINNIFDISNIDINNIKLINSDYNSHNLFNEIILLIKGKNNKNIDFKYSITSSLPEYLYGDSLRLKQIICSIIAYCIKIIKKGIIDLDISTIISYDICRLIITINDNGNGISLDIINRILETNTNIDEKEIENESSLEVDIYLVKKIIDMIGGTLLIKSEDDLGTTYTIIINQKIKKVKNNKVISQNTKYSLSNKKHILIIDDNYQELENFAKAFRFNNFDVTTTMYGKDCINKLNNGEKFDYIFIDDEMNPLNAVEIIKNIDMKKEKVIIMLSKNKERIKKHYINDYQFNDYFLKNIYKSEIKRIMNK